MPTPPDRNHDAHAFHAYNDAKKRRYALTVLADITTDAVQHLIYLQRFSTESSSVTNYTPDVPISIRNSDDENYAESLDSHLSLAMFEADRATATLDELDYEIDNSLDAKRTSDSFGGPQMFIDVAMHEHLVTAINRRLPSVPVVGEESKDPEWSHLPNLLPGDLVVIIDPVDGSVPFQVTGANYSIVTVLCHEVTTSDPTDEGHLEVIGAVLADPLGCVFILDLVEMSLILQRTSGGDTQRRLLSDPAQPLAPANPWVVASVAVSPNGRRRIAPLFRTSRGWGMPPQKHGGTVRADPAASVVTLGGNPAACHMATGGLGFLVFAEWSTVFDAIGLLLLAVQPNRFEFTRLDTGQPITSNDLINLFHDIHRPPPPGRRTYGPGTYKPIPPILAVRAGSAPVHLAPGELPNGPNETVADRIASALVWSFKHTPNIE